MLYQTLSHTLKLAPHESPSSQPLTKNPQQLCYFLCPTLKKDPQQVWQTLKNFDYSKIIQTPLCKVVMWCFSLIFKARIKEFYMVSTYCVDFLGIVLSFCCQYFTPAPTSQKDFIIAYLFFISFVIL